MFCVPRMGVKATRLRAGGVTIFDTYT